MFDATKDPAISHGYSLPRSKHEALRAIAQHRGHGNATRLLDEIVEAFLRNEFGRYWQRTYVTALAAEEDEERREQIA